LREKTCDVASTKKRREGKKNKSRCELDQTSVQKKSKVVVSLGKEEWWLLARGKNERA